MLERLVEIKRVLKDTGSVYLHCDHEANAYLRQLMDAVFGAKNFRNEITWERFSGRSKGSQFAPSTWGSHTDTILFYAKSKRPKINPYRAMDANEIAERFPKVDSNGRRYTTIAHFRGEAMGARPNLCYEWRGFKNPHPSGWRISKERLEQEYHEGSVVIRPDGKLERRRYADKAKGVKMGSLWTDINAVQNTVEETGYPTQKPQALARRIIEASSNPGDVVLDCFAGCAYVPVAAELTGRRWIACDMSPRSWTVVRRQFHKQDSLRIRTEGELAYDEPLQFRLDDDRVIAVRGPEQLPKRDTPRQATLPVRPLPAVKYKQRPLETSQQIWEAFVEQYGPECWYCGRLTRPDRRLLHLDHVEPNRRDGTNDDCWNRALACSPCNSDKSNNPDLDKVFNKALEEGRISSQAKLDEIRRNFDERRQWARRRWETIPKQKQLQENVA